MKNSFKKIISILICSFMLLPLIPAAASAADVPAAPVIPGYTQYTASTLDTTLNYLIVTADSSGNTYALYSSEAGTEIYSGGLYEEYGNGTCTAALTIGDSAVSAAYLKDSSALDMSKLHFTAAESSGSYTLSANGYYLVLGNYMFSSSSSALTIEKNTNVTNGYYISGSGRWLTFNKTGDTLSGGSNSELITDFWGPNTALTETFPIYLYVEGNWEAPVENPYAAEKPADGVTNNHPFAKGTGGSGRFRIPGMVTLSDGTIVAAADARWDDPGDGNCIDTMVSVSRDNGATWNYSFVNYFNDTADAKDPQKRATAFIDPVITVGEDDTLYLLVDVFPGGTAFGGGRQQPAVSTGHVKIDSVERMVLYASPVVGEQNETNYTHYIGDNRDGFAPVYNVSTGATDYYVDAEYYLYDTDKNVLYCEQLNTGKLVRENVFYWNARLHVRATDYLWMRTSTDKGVNWSEPIILDSQIEATRYIVGPGTGICMDDGTIVIPMYSNCEGTDNETASRSGFIYSNDRGTTWHRAEDATREDYSGECVIVQIGQDTLREFYRDYHETIHYVDYIRNTETGEWKAGEPVDTGFAKTVQCQMSAIMYSKPINGRKTILLSTGTASGSARYNGKIYALSLNEKNNMDLISYYTVNQGVYGYSTLAELSDGSIGLLYETGDDLQIPFSKISIENIVGDAFVGDTKEISVPIYKTVTADCVGAAPTDEELAALDSTVVTATASKKNVSMAALGRTVSFDERAVSLDRAAYKFTASGNGYVISTNTEDGRLVYLRDTGRGGFPNSGTGTKVTVTNGKEDGTFYLNFARSYLYFQKDGKNCFDTVANVTYCEDACSFLLYRKAEQDESDSSEIPGYIRVTDASQIKSGQSYIIVSKVGDSYYALFPSLNFTDKYTHAAKITTQETATISYYGKKAGTTSFAGSGVTYNVNVVDGDVTAVSVQKGASTEIEVEAASVTYNSNEAAATVTVVTDDQRVAVYGAQGNLGTDNTFAGGLAPMSDALYTFAKSGTNWHISGKTADGETVYLNIAGTGVTAGYPTSATEAANIALKENTDGTFYVVHGVNYLYFWQDGKARFDRIGSTTPPEPVKFAIYRPIADGENESSEIPGYIQVTALSDIADGGRYLIVNKCTYDNCCYALYPAVKGSNYYDHVIKVNAAAEKVSSLVGTITYKMTVNGLAVGTTDVIVGDKIYRITVTE